MPSIELIAEDESDDADCDVNEESTRIRAVGLNTLGKKLKKEPTGVTIDNILIIIIKTPAAMVVIMINFICFASIAKMSRNEILSSFF